MGMYFSPMYQPVSTKTIKADGDLNINPYDLLATDVKCDTVEASEFVGGVGNFSSLVLPTLNYNGFVDYDFNLSLSSSNVSAYTTHKTLLSSPIPLNGVVSLKATGLPMTLEVLSVDGKSVSTLTNTQTEYTITNAYNIGVKVDITSSSGKSLSGILTFGIPKFV